MTATALVGPAYPVQFRVDYPDRPLNRLTSAFRLFAAGPILLVLVWVSGSGLVWSHGGRDAAVGAGGVLFSGPLMDDRYPSTDEQQAVHVDYVYPDAGHELNRWTRLVKWLLAIPHFAVFSLAAPPSADS